MCHSARENPTPETAHHRVVDLTGTRQKAATRCRPLMVAYVLRAFRQDDADIRERIGHIHRCVSNRSSNFGADKSVTVPARASRIKVMRDMINGGEMSL